MRHAIRTISTTTLLLAAVACASWHSFHSETTIAGGQSFLLGGDQASSFVATVRKVLLETEANARNFELELTEGILIERSPETLSALVELKLLGFALVIDDFGAGHSSFQYLRNFPIDKLKIDQMFVRQLVIDSSDALIIRAIASLARSLRLGLVAEGIETLEQRNFLRDQGCETGQGYFFSLPLAAEDFAWMLEKDVVLPVMPEKQTSPHPAWRAA